MRLLLASALLLAACGSVRTLPAYRRAVVVHGPAQRDAALAARQALLDDGWEVDVSPAGPAQRGRSSLAVYSVRKFPKMPEHLEGVLAGAEPPVGAFETLPFMQPGPGGASAVLWLE
ncbi:MAG: hypothetical protein HMLKMBBP_01608 [Planctomycetes bacterium]|nr:hypothetical protein [Planctomycetota bacterium]